MNISKMQHMKNDKGDFVFRHYNLKKSLSFMFKRKDQKLIRLDDGMQYGRIT